MKRIDLKVFRIKQDLTQEQMAKKLNISRQQYSNIENGKENASFKLMTRFEEVFEYSDLWELFKKGDEK